MMDLESQAEALKFLSLNKGFLGREFLTWLWYFSESQNHQIHIPSLGQFKFYIDDKIVLVSSGGSVLESALKGGTPAYAQESVTALKSGKLIQEAKLVLQNADHLWSWTLRGDDMTLRGLRLPSVQESDAFSHMQTRIRHLETLNQVMEYLFNHYLYIRSSSKFSESCIQIQDWIRSKS